MWSDLDDAIIGGDLTAALAYATPAGGAVPTPVAPIGLRDREAGTVSFTTSLGFGRKLDRIKENPRVALAYHAREHGFARDPRYVLVQGMASYDSRPDRAVLEERVRPASIRFMGAPKTGVFWDRWLSAYYADRVLVTVQVERVLSWPDLACAGERTVVGTPLTDEDPPSQAPSRQGQRAARGRRARGAAGGQAAARARSPTSAPTAFRWLCRSPWAPPAPRASRWPGRCRGGGRRAGLLAHRYEAQLIGLETRQYTGWLQDSVYAPHTENGFRAPANKTVLLLGNGFMARRGLKRARALGRA